MSTTISEIPEIMKLWSNKNTLNPEDITSGSNKKALWECKKGHTWEDMIKLFMQKDKKCPYCSGKKAIKGETDLGTLYPNLKKEWNDKRDISSILPNSSYKADWKCKLDHKWKNSIEKSALRGQNCPYCAGRKILSGFNDLETLCPEILYLWDYDKNKILPSEISKGSHKKVWWKCEFEHSWLKDVQVLTNKKVLQRCPYCSNHRIITGFNDIATTHSEFLKIWDYDKNKDIADPETLTFASGKRVWWKCELNHSWNGSISKIIANNRGCPYCSNPPKRILTGFNDLATKNPEVLEYWNFNKNTIDPTKIAPHSERKVWWKCELNHEWESAITKLSGGNRCPYCNGKRVLKGFNDLLTFCPNITDVWLDEKPPSFYHKGSEKSVSILCPENGEIFQSSIHRITAIYPYCPCYNCISGVSKFEKEINQFIKSLEFETTTSNRSIISPKELDIVIESKKIAIECNGDYWHSDEVMQFKNNMSAKNFHQLKKDLAKDAGYDLFFVWENDWKDRKDFIQAELSQILNNNYENITLLNRLE